MMDTFVEEMRKFALIPPVDNSTWVGEDIEIFKNAYHVMTKLGEYHARASFDEWNIEDLLSILSLKR